MIRRGLLSSRTLLFTAAGAVALGIAVWTWALQDSKEWKAPASAAKKRNPIPAEEKSIEAGKQIYTRECLSCHGPRGRGDGPQAKDLEKSPGNLTAPTMWNQTDGELFWKITEGRSPMPGFGKLLTEQERWHVINFIRTLAPRK